MTILIHLDTPKAKVVIHLRAQPGALTVACGAKARASWTNESPAITCPDCRRIAKAQHRARSTN
jgi:hypothetical protein